MTTDPQRDDAWLQQRVGPQTCKVGSSTLTTRPPDDGTWTGLMTPRGRPA